MLQTALIKQCTGCSVTKPLDDFHRQVKGKYGRIASCKSCMATANKKYYQTDKNRHCDRSHRKRLERRYGITMDQVVAMAQFQGHKCVICKREGSVLRGVHHSGKLVVDHNHKNGVVRGLLCHGCNSAIGYFRDEPNLMIQAMRYLWTDGRTSEVVFFKEMMTRGDNNGYN